MNRFLQLTVFLLCVLLLFPAAVYADQGEFDAFLRELRGQLVIPDAGGKITSYSSFEDTLTNMGSYEWFPFAASSNFVFSAHVDWLSASQSPNGAVSGCGLVFGADAAANNHILASLRMDGNLYVTGMKNYGRLSYAKTFISNPSMSGSADLRVVLNGGHLTIYLNGQKIEPSYNVAVMGEDIGFAVLSGTNKDFGTRCTWNDIFLYTWE